MTGPRRVTPQPAPPAPAAEESQDVVWLEPPSHLAQHPPAEPEAPPELEPIAEVEPAPPPPRASTPRTTAARTAGQAPLFTPRRSADKSWPASPPAADESEATSPAPPRRRGPALLIGGIVIALAAGGGAAALLLGRGRGTQAPDSTAQRPAAVATPAPAPAPAHADSAARADSIARADSAARAAAAPAAAAPAAAPATISFLRLSGDLPDDAVISLDGEEMSGTFLRTTPGQHEIDIESNDFLPWTKTITVRPGDTLRVRVDLELKPDSTEQR